MLGGIHAEHVQRVAARAADTRTRVVADQQDEERRGRPAADPIGAGDGRELLDASGTWRPTRAARAPRPSTRRRRRRSRARQRRGDTRRDAIDDAASWCFASRCRASGRGRRGGVAVAVLRTALTRYAVMNHVLPVWANVSSTWRESVSAPVPLVAVTMRSKSVATYMSSPSVPSSAESVTGVAVVERTRDLADAEIGQRGLVGYRSRPPRTPASNSAGVLGADVAGLERGEDRVVDVALREAEHGLARGRVDLGVVGPALSTSTEPTFKTEVLTARTFGVVVGVDSACGLAPPLEHAASVSERASASAPGTALETGLRSSTGAIFAFARRYPRYLNVEAAACRCGNSSEKFTKPVDEQDREHLVTWCAERGGSPLDGLALRQPVRIAGEIRSVRIVPRAGAASLEATVQDGRGHDHRGVPRSAQDRGTFARAPGPARGRRRQQPQPAAGIKGQAATA